MAAMARLNTRIQTGEISKSKILKQVADTITGSEESSHPRVATQHTGPPPEVAQANLDTLQRVANTIPTSTNPTAQELSKQRPGHIENEPAEVGLARSR